MLSKIGQLKGKKGLIVIVLVAILGWAGFSVSEKDVADVVDAFVVDDTQDTAEKHQTAKVKQDFNNVSIISSKRRIHILYGDATGGGHKFGTGTPCKSEFPKHWSDDTIIKEIEVIAANDNLNWEQQRNGYYVTEQSVGTVKVRVVKGRNNKQVITAYPTNTGRNPCLQKSPSNDN